MKNVGKPFLLLSYHASLSDLWDTTWFSVLEYTKIWFDKNIMQFLICRNKDFFTWTPQANDKTSRIEFFVHIEDLQPSRIIFARISLDSLMLVVQHSNVQLSVFHIESKRRWRIEIRSPEENRILNHGIIWSEHSGNSQDLILVTSFGLELYKVSNSRSQCKLSHIINYKTVGFYYEPNNRMIFLMIKVETNNTSNDYPLSLKGYTLPYDIPSDVPKFELPRPRSVGVLPLESNIGPDDVTVLSLYSKVYCIIRKPLPTGFLLSFYALINSEFIKTHIVDSPLFSRVTFSVSDNVVYVHCMEAQTTLIIDISTCTPPTEVEVPQAPSFLQTLSLVLEGHPTGGLPDAIRYSVDSGLIVDGVHRPHLQSDETPLTAAEIVTSYWRESGAANSTASPSPYMSPVPDKEEALEEFLDMQSSDSSAGKYSDGCNSDTRNSRTTQLQVTDNLYSRLWQLFPASNWVWDPANLALWRLRCCLPSLVASTVDAHKVVTFLACRGQSDRSPKPVSTLPEEDPTMVKRQLLLIIRRVFQSFSNRSLSDEYQSGASNLERTQGTGYDDGSRVLLQCFLSAAMSPYVTFVMDTNSHPPPTVGKSSSSSSPVPSTKSAFSLRSIGIFSSTSSSSAAASKSAVTLDSDNSTTIDLEPLEAIQALLPEVLAVGTTPPLPRSDSARASPGTMRAGPSPAAVRRSMSPVMALTTLRDHSGRLLVTQTELLAHVFLPLLRDTTVRPTACIELLTMLVDVLRTPVLSTLHGRAVGAREEVKAADPALSVAVEPSLCILLLRLLVAENQWQRVQSLVQLRYFSESSDFAMVMLELADSICITGTGDVNSDTSTIAGDGQVCTSSPGMGSGDSLRTTTVQALRSAGLDMLWQLRDRVAVVRWLLSHGRLVDAVGLCLRDQRGQWQAGLEPPDSVPGLEFFLSAVESLKAIPDDKVGWKVEVMYTVTRFLMEWDEDLIRMDKVLE